MTMLYALRRVGTLALAGMIPATIGAAARAGEPADTLPETLVTASRLGEGVTGASTTVITAEEIERSPGQTLPEILSRQPGIQVQTMFGGVNGANATVDMRGFGATATPNTLVLINGRRLNDVDLAGVDFASIPRSSIDRIEITRGNGAAVLYGDGAVGGVINIVTKTGIGQPASGQAEIALGTLGHREASASVAGSVGATALSVHGAAINADGYRVNNEMRQRSVVAEARHGLAEGELYLNVSADSQHLGLPGGRTVTLSSSQLASDRKGAATLDDYGDKQGLNAAFGGFLTLGDGIELILDAGIRHKEQQSGFFSSWGAAFNSYYDTALTTLSLTPRVIAEHGLFGLPGRMTGGVDLYHSIYSSDRMVNKGDDPAHRYDLSQTSLAGYVQETVSVRSDTDLSAGLRVQGSDITARDHYNPSAPNSGTTLAGVPYDHAETHYAAHVGLDHRLDDRGGTTLFARIGRSFRLPTVDERVGQSPWGTPVSFNLKAQTSHDAEIGLRGTWGDFGLQSSLYWMDLKNELHYSPATYTNINLDPTRRYGAEMQAGYHLTETVRLKAGGAYTRAQFTTGSWKDNDVPLVSRWSGTAGISWDIWDKLVVLDTDLRYLGRRRADNDQGNTQPWIPDHAVVDLRLGGAVERVHWSVAVQNLLDHPYYEYAIASATTYGRYNAYPLPGRTVIGRLGVHF